MFGQTIFFLALVNLGKQFRGAIDQHNRHRLGHAKKLTRKGRERRINYCSCDKQ
jgi:hypothetical protein